MIYLDHAATRFPRAPGVAEAMVRFLEEDSGNPGRGGHALSQSAARVIDRCRLQVAQLIGAESPNRIIFTSGATDALNMAILGALGREGGHVVTTAIEHNAVNRPLQRLVDEGCITLTRVRCDDQGSVSSQEIRMAMRPDTRMIAISHASNVVGTIQDIQAIGAIARTFDALLLLDACQTLGVLSVHVQHLGVDLLASSGHKALGGPPGIGVLYVGPRAEPVSPLREGGTGGDSQSPRQPNALPIALEAGTANSVGIAGLSAALDHLATQDMSHMLQHEQSLIQHCHNELVEHDDRFILFGDADATQSVGVLALKLLGHNSQEVATILDQHFQIAVRAGLHCSPYTHEQLGTAPDGAIRVSVGPTNTSTDIDTLIAALHEIANA